MKEGECVEIRNSVCIMYVSYTLYVKSMDLRMFDVDLRCGASMWIFGSHHTSYAPCVAYICSYHIYDTAVDYNIIQTSLRFTT